MSSSDFNPQITSKRFQTNTMREQPINTTSSSFLNQAHKLPTRFNNREELPSKLAFKMPKEYSMSNNNYIRFNFFEILNVKTVPWDNGRGYTEHVPQCDDTLIKKINSLVSN